MLKSHLSLLLLWSWKKSSMVLFLWGSLLCSDSFFCVGSRLFAAQQIGYAFQPDDVERIWVGMSQLQVQELLGEPTLNIPFETNRWYYIQTESSFFANPNGLKVKKLEIVFDAIERRVIQIIYSDDQDEDGSMDHVAEDERADEILEEAQ